MFALTNLSFICQPPKTNNHRSFFYFNQLSHIEMMCVHTVYKLIIWSIVVFFIFLNVKLNYSNNYLSQVKPTLIKIKVFFKTKTKNTKICHVSPKSLSSFNNVTINLLKPTGRWKMRCRVLFQLQSLWTERLKFWSKRLSLWLFQTLESCVPCVQAL